MKRSSTLAALVTTGLLLLCGVSGLRADWQLNGIPVCAENESQDGPQVTSDGVGGAIIVWVDHRNGAPDVYAQRVNATGNPIWATGGVVVSSGDSVAAWLSPAFGSISDGEEGAIIAWTGHRNGNPDIFAQRIDGEGQPLWGPDGVSVCAADSVQSRPRVVDDGSGGAIIIWTDRRGNGDESTVCAQRIDASGTAIWATNGVAVGSVAGDDSYTLRPNVVSDGTGGAIVVWAWEGVYAQRIDESGVTQWMPAGVLVSATGIGPVPASDGTGGAVVAWLIYSENDFDVYAQKLDEDGMAQWGPSGVVIGGGEPYSQPMDILSDGGGGAVVAWGDFSARIYVQRVDTNGETNWTAGGIDLRNPADPRSQWEPRISSDGLGGVIVTWFQWMGGSNHDIYAQSIDATGSIRWAVGGVGMCVLPSNQRSPRICSDGTGGAIIAWEDWRNGDTDVYAMRINSQGQVPTLLRTYVAEVVGSNIAIEWTLSQIDEGARFVVLRADAERDKYEELDSAKVARRGLSFLFVDASCEPGVAYKYRVDAVVDSRERWTLFEAGPIATPRASLALFQNTPNPFNPLTTISFALPESERASLSIFDVEGRLVKTLVDEMVGEGRQERAWDGKDANGSTVGSGVYFYRLTAGNRSLTKKMILLK